MYKNEIISEMLEALDKAQRWDELILDECEGRVTIMRNDRSYDDIVIKEGRKYLLKSALPLNPSVLPGESFEDWVKRSVLWVPDSMSKDGFIAYFDHELRETYRSIGAVGNVL